MSIDTSETAAATTGPHGPVAEIPGFEHHYSQAGGARIHYVKGGQGPAVVLLHGWPYTWRVWSRTLPLLAAAGYTVIAPDLRGLGDSTPEDGGQGYDKVSVAQDIAHIARAHGFATINLVGMDIGAMVAFAYAITYPDQIDHLVLSESAIPGHGLEEVMNPATGGFWHFGFHMQADLATMLTEGKEAAYLTPMWQIGSQRGGLTETDRTDFLEHYTQAGGMHAGFDHYATLLQDAAHNRAHHTILTMPVLVLNADGGLPQQLLTTGLEPITTDLHTVTIPDSAHAYPADNPTATAETLTRFFSDRL